MRYRDLVKMNELVCTKSMCKKIGRLSQGWGKHAVTDTIEFIFHKDKPKERRTTYVRAVYDFFPQKTETYRTRINAGVKSYIEMTR